MKTVIEMAMQAGFTEGELAFMGDNFIRFAELVRADERDKWMERTAILIRGEREACAQIADSMDPLQDGAIGKAIRER